MGYTTWVRASRRYFWIGGITLFLGIISFAWLVLWVPGNIEFIKGLSSANPTLFALVFVVYKAISIVFPPLPGGMLSYAMVPVIGWWKTFVYSSSGIMIGSVIGFWIARRFREPVVKKFVPVQKLHEWQKRKSERQEFFGFLGLRLTTAPVFDFMNYVAGISKISFRKFFVVTAISLIPEGVLFYIGEEAFKRSAYLGLLTFVLFVFTFYILQKKKFFESEPKENEEG